MSRFSDEATTPSNSTPGGSLLLEHYPEEELEAYNPNREKW